MKTFTSKVVRVEKSAQEVYNFLSDFNNFGQLMPPEISNWQSDQLSCTFTIANMADLSMAFGECVQPSLITMISSGKNPFDYVLKTHIQPKEEKQTEVQLVFEADLNPMLIMVASKPLENFVNILADKLGETLNSQA